MFHGCYFKASARQEVTTLVFLQGCYAVSQYNTTHCLHFELILKSHAKFFPEEIHIGIIKSVLTHFG